MKKEKEESLKSFERQLLERGKTIMSVSPKLNLLWRMERKGARCATRDDERRTRQPRREVRKKGKALSFAASMF
jgi:hypothetical protein